MPTIEIGAAGVPLAYVHGQVPLDFTMAAPKLNPAGLMELSVSLLPGSLKRIEQVYPELEGKLPEPDEDVEQPEAKGEPGDPLAGDAVSALVNLGYPEKKAAKAVKAALGDDTVELSELLKAALKEIS